MAVGIKAIAHRKICRMAESSRGEQQQSVPLTARFSPRELIDSPQILLYC